MDRVHFVGFRHDVPDLLRAADCFVLPSLYEGLPNAVLEAMAAALPVVATAVDGSIEAVEDGITGTLVPPSDPAALEAAIVSILSREDEAEAMGVRGRERAERVFDLREQIARFEELYERLVERNERP